MSSSIPYAQRRAEAIAYSSRPLNTHETGQKFPRGARVKVADEMPDMMKYFPCGFEAIVAYTYAQKFHGDDIDSYSLIQLDERGKAVNSNSWYHE